MPAFNVVNPYKTGSWLMGIGFLVTCLWGNGRQGLVWGLAMLACYLITAAVSVVGLITLTSGLDLLWYLHPVLIIIAIICAIPRKRRQ